MRNKGDWSFFIFAVLFAMAPLLVFAMLLLLTGCAPARIEGLDPRGASKSDQPQDAICRELKPPPPDCKP